MHSAIIVADLNGRIFQWLDRFGPVLTRSGGKQAGSGFQFLAINFASWAMAVLGIAGYDANPAVLEHKRARTS